MEIWGPKAMAREDRKTRAGEIITGIGGILGKNLWCTPTLLYAHVKSNSYGIILEGELLRLPLYPQC